MIKLEVVRMNKQGFSTNKSIGILGILLVLGIVGLIFWNQQGNRNTLPQEENVSAKPTTETSKSEVVDKQSFSTNKQSFSTNRQASFAIFTNGTFRVFTASMYHNLSQDVYIEASNPNVVKVKKAGITWNDFFKTLPFKLTKDCLTTGTKETFCTDSRKRLRFYLNGEINGIVLDQEIKDGDKLLVTYGSESEDIIKKQIDKIPQ